jgi:hypothetical protein
MLQNVNEKIIFTFNTYFYDFLADLKTIVTKDKVRSINRKYPTRLHNTLDNLSYIDSIFTNEFKAAIMDDSAVATYGDLEIFPGVNYSVVAAGGSVMNNYILIFMLLLKLYNNDDSLSEDALSSLFLNTLTMLGHVQSNNAVAAAASKSDINVEDIVAVLDKMTIGSNDDESSETFDETAHAFDPAIQNTPIGKIAKEIADDMNLENIKSPEDLLKSEVIGDLFSKVSSKLQGKFADGSINQAQIMEDAKKMMSMFGGPGQENGNLFSNIMKNMSGMSGMAGMSGMSGMPGIDKNKVKKMATKERLREKLAKKNDEAKF